MSVQGQTRRPPAADVPEARAGGGAGQNGRHRERSRVPRALTLPGIVLLAGVLRLVGVLSAYDIYTDEFIYRDEGFSVLRGHVPPLEPDGAPFLVHPPGLFLLEARWMQLVGIPADPFEQIESLRVMQAVLALVSLVLLFLLVRRAAGRTPALVAAGLFAADPYILRQNGRILQETAVLLFVLGGYLCLLALVRARGTPHPRAAVWGAGLLFGFAVVTKDIAVALTVLPLAVLLAAGWGPPRRRVAAVLAILPLPYLGYAAWTWGQGLGAELWAFKLSGVERMVGLDVYTGYNVEGAPSVTTTFLAQFLDYGVSFALIGAGCLGAAYLLLRPGHEVDRVLAVVTLSAAAVVGYATVFSTIEEHFLYFVAVPGTATAVVAGHRVLHLDRWPRAARRRLTGLVVAVLVVVAGLDAAAWVHTRTVPDTGQEQAVAWLEDNAPSGSVVAAVADQTEEALVGSGLRPVPVDDPNVLASQNVRYLVVLTKLVNQGYVGTSPADVRWFRARGREVFSVPSRSYDEVVILETTSPAAW